MPRRPRLREADIAAAIAALRKAGIEPSALDILPDGTLRWLFTPPADDDDPSRDFDMMEERHFRKRES